ncbi:MAG: hypothetical protein ABI200_06900, partial [Gaiellales bacterium]
MNVTATAHRQLRSPRTLLMLLLLPLALLLASPPPAAHADSTRFPSRSGVCNGTEGVTVIVDMAPADEATSTAPTYVRCVFGTPTDGIDALDRAGFDYQVDSSWGDPFVCSIEAKPNPCGTGWWSYWIGTSDGWDFSSLGAGDQHSKPGTIEGWRWVPSYTAESSAPRSAPHVAATVTAVSATVASPHNATVKATVAAGGSAQQVHVEYATGSDHAAAIRTSAQSVNVDAK